jgi:hypothetical protein
MPHTCAAAKIVSLTLPSAFTGVKITSSATPASLAGTAFIIRVEGYAAVPPGTYKPTRLSGRTICPIIEPSRLYMLHEGWVWLA